MSEVRGEIISGNAISAQIIDEVKQATEELIAEHNVTPGLAVVLVGNRTDSATYVKMKKRAAANCGFHSIDIDLPVEVSQDELLAEIDKLNNDPKVPICILPKHAQTTLRT